MELLELTRDLVAINSSKGQPNEDIINYLADYCERIGCTVTRFEYKGEQNLKQCNLVAIKGGSGRPALAFSGHTDTVLFDEAKWKSYPLKLNYRDGKYFALGVADMKLFLAIALKAAESVPSNLLKRPFALYFTAEEEIGCLGAKDLTGFCHTPKTPQIEIASNIVIGEPTMFEPVNKHKGYCFFRVFITAETDGHARNIVQNGKHSSDDTQTTNVVDAVLPEVLTALREFRESLRNLTDLGFKLPYPTMNIGGNVIISGGMKNIIPTEAKLECDLRSIPGLEFDDLRYLMQRKLDSVVKKIKPVNPGEKITARIKPAKMLTPPMNTPFDAEIVTNAVASSGHALAKGVSYNTEGGIYSAAGAKTVILGPGSIDQAHQIDEFADEMWFTQDIVDRYASMIHHFCAEEES